MAYKAILARPGAPPGYRRTFPTLSPARSRWYSVKVAEYHVETFGCRANQADGHALEAGLRMQGMVAARTAAQADLVVLNTCSVTAEAERTARAYLRKVRRSNPRARIVATGCYAQRAPEEVRMLPGVDLVVGNSHKSLLAGLSVPAADFVPLHSLLSEGSATAEISFQSPRPGTAVYADEAFPHAPLSIPEEAWREGGRGAEAAPASVPAVTRPSLKVQDGCGNRCAFCIIPFTRGPSRSLPLEDCLRRIESFAVAGGVELVLSGINLGRWGRDLNPPRQLEDLIEAVLARTSLPRLRLSSIEPMDWTPRLLDLFGEHASGAAPRIARHAHLPLQSGSDSILRAMHRRYRPWHYAEKLRILHANVPDSAIGGDVMIGFPGETEKLFEESLAFIEAQPFTYLHLFRFSPRPGSPAERLAARPSAATVDLRMERLRRLILKKNREFRERFLSRELPAVTLHTPAGEKGSTRALSDNFLPLRLDSSLTSNREVRVVVRGLIGEGLTASVISRSISRSGR